MSFTAKWPSRMPSMYERYNITPDQAKDLTAQIVYLKMSELLSVSKIALQLDIPVALVNLLWRRAR